MTTPYRHMEDSLGLEEREGQAVTALGRWRSAIRGRVVGAFVLLGVGAGLLGYGAMIELQWRLMGVAWLWGAGVGFLVPFAAFCALGVVAARVVVRRRMPARVAALAARFQVPAERVAEIARLADRI
jgi:hypothetical protein